MSSSPLGAMQLLGVFGAGAGMFSLVSPEKYIGFEVAKRKNTAESEA